MEDLEEQLRIGLSRVGVAEIDSYPSELEGLRALVATADRGDVLAVMVHADRVKLDEWLRENGATVDSPTDIRRKVTAARGEHEAEAAIAELWANPDEQARILAAQALADTAVGDPRLIFELASAHDSAGDDQQAIALYDKALGAGLREPHRHRALMQQASSYRNVGDLAGARRILDALSEQRPGSAAVAAFRALTMLDQGEQKGAVADLINVLLSRSGDADDDAYRESLHRYAEELR
jgi:cyanophycin synthetase